MNTGWAIRVDASAADAIANLRTESGIEICAQHDPLWCRGKNLTSALAARLRKIPGAWRYRVLEDGALVPVGCLVPLGTLPSGPWIALRDWLQIELPPVAVSRAEFQKSRLPKTELTVVRAPGVAAPSLLETTATQWRHYGSQAPAVRLGHWMFAMTATGRCLIRGVPLPPLPGTQIVDHEGLLIPVGWSWRPHLEPAVIRQLLGLETGQMALFHPEGSWEMISASDWVGAMRSAIRLSLEQV